jgi:polysaccharide export outer membrane protein
MRIKTRFVALVLMSQLALAGSIPVLAQQPSQPPQDASQKKGVLGKIFGETPKGQKKGDGSNAGAQPPASAAGQERLEPDDTNTMRSDVPAEIQANRREQLSEEEAAVVPYYNNFLKDYRLGPEDVITVEVFDQPRYSKTGITIPPNGTISYPLIPEGVFVVGKTTQQVQEEITKKLDEYIIDPKVTVSLEKAQSARYSVLGDVGQPGIRIMTRRVSVYEALAEAGGVLPTGDKSKVVILRRQPDGTLLPIRVNIKKIERGEAREMAFLVPGDQVLVPGNRFKTFQQIMGLLPVLSFARIFTGGW